MRKEGQEENWTGLEKWPHSTLGEGGGAKHIFLQLAKLFFRAGNSVGRRRHSEVAVPTALARMNSLWVHSCSECQNKLYLVLVRIKLNSKVGCTNKFREACSSKSQTVLSAIDAYQPARYNFIGCPKVFSTLILFSRKKATHVIFYLLQRHTTGKGDRIVWTQRTQIHQSKRAFSAFPFVANCPPPPLMQTSPIPNISFSIQTYTITGLLES